MPKPSVAVQIASYLGLAEFILDKKIKASRGAVGCSTRNDLLQQSSGENLPAVDQFY